MKINFCSSGIKKKNKGKFTDYCGGTDGCIQRGKNSSNPTTRKRATFASNARAWKHQDGGNINPYSAGALVEAIYKNAKGEKNLGEPSHHYDFTQSEEWANAHGYYPDSRNHRDDRVKKPAHPSSPSRGNWKSLYQFDLTSMEDPNYTLFGLVDNGQDPQAIMTYKNSIVLPEITVTPKGSYIHNSYDNRNVLFMNGGTY